jgi:glycosyltransferase involved in cell wall biosynthesis
MKLSMIVATRNRAHAIAPCLDSIAASFAHAALPDAEIVVADNGSTDKTAAIIKQWTASSGVAVKSLFEPRPGKGHALNCALRAAQGDLLAFTDDDCRLTKNYVSDLLRYHTADREPVLRGGRIELGDPTDLPLTINTTPERVQWHRRLKSARHRQIAGMLNGCNLTMPRAIVEKLGPFDERFGPGSMVGNGDDSEYLFRAYIAYIALEYVPDMTVIHWHGRKTAAQGRKLLQSYARGCGATYAKFFWRHPDVCRPFVWDVNKAVQEILTGSNVNYPSLDFSFKNKLAWAVRGAVKYFVVASWRPSISKRA